MKLKLDKHYKNHFTSKVHFKKLKHPSNAISSISFLILGINILLSKQHDKYIKYGIGNISIILAILSYFFHATEINLIGLLDALCIYFLKLMIGLIQMGISTKKSMIISYTFCFIMISLMYKSKKNISLYFGEKREPEILLLLTSIILATLPKKSPKLLFLISYIFKFSDLSIAYFTKFRTKNIFLQGTSIYHILIAETIRRLLKNNIFRIKK